METVDRYMEYFIRRKMDEDASWRNIEVIYSGFRCPGEGEHKIMDFVRSLKSQGGYDPNTRHCLHGMDADLLLLSLATHEPYFCILREKALIRVQRGKVTGTILPLRYFANPSHRIFYLKYTMLV